MEDDEENGDGTHVTTFKYTEGPEIESGEWTWLVSEGKRRPHIRCTCGTLMHLNERFTIASDGLVGSTRGRGFKKCPGASACPRRPGRMLLGGWEDHGTDTLRS